MVLGGIKAAIGPTLMGGTMLEIMAIMMAGIQQQLRMEWCGLLLQDFGIH